MKPTERLAEATAPDGSVLSLLRHDGAYLMRVNGIELMSTRRVNSESRLADFACAPIADRARARTVIGGLGFGFTLKAALKVLAPDAEVTVVEIVQAVIDWNLHPDWALAREALEDGRVRVVCDDIGNVLRQNPAAYDAIMLDVDNGADSLTTKGNKRLYGDHGVRAAIAALAHGGRLAYWSSQPDEKFKRTLERNGMAVETHSVRSHPTAGGYYTLFIARRIKDSKAPEPATTP